MIKTSGRKTVRRDAITGDLEGNRREKISCIGSAVAIYKSNGKKMSPYVAEGQIIVDVAKESRRVH